MTFDDLQLLLDYHYWARDRVLAATDLLTAEQRTRDLGSSFTSVHDTLVHIYSAEWAWYSRWHGNPPTKLLDPALFPDLAAIRSAWTTMERDVRGFVAALGPDGVNRVFDYTMLSGLKGRSVFWQMVAHLVNHASYHRGQVTTMLRQLGAAPAKSMDMIAFYRETETAGGR